MPTTAKNAMNGEIHPVDGEVVTFVQNVLKGQYQLKG